MRGAFALGVAAFGLACGNPFVFVDDDFGRVAALQLCTENGDPFDGLELRFVPGPSQTPEGEPPGCVRLRFRRGGDEAQMLRVELSGELRLVEGRREVRPSCGLNQPPPERIVALREATGAGTLDGDELRIDAELTFEDEASFSLATDDLQVLRRDCEDEL